MELSSETLKKVLTLKQKDLGLLHIILRALSKIGALEQLSEAPKD